MCFLNIDKALKLFIKLFFNAKLIFICTVISGNTSLGLTNDMFLYLTMFSENSAIVCGMKLVFLATYYNLACDGLVLLDTVMCIRPSNTPNTPYSLIS